MTGTQYVLLPSTSPTVNLQVLALPSPVITHVSWPAAKKKGTTLVPVSVTYRNDGGDGVIFLKLRNSAGSQLDYFEDSVTAGETATVTLYFTMPGNDIVLYVDVGRVYDGVVTDTEGPHTVELLVEVATSLTLSVSPNPAYPGEKVKWSGKLSRADGANPGAQTIKLYYSVEEWGSTTTDAAGNFSGTFTAPTTPGTYALDAYFGGASLMAPAHTRIVLSFDPDGLIRILTPGVLGLILVSYAVWRK